ncbi:MAG: hypothetical protein AAF413_00315 [Patescibacteria group bacterium]
MRSTRPTKKQKAMLEYIEQFIVENGYSPSYREIMVGLDYNSVATVAKHIENLVARGHLIKRPNSARSIEPSNMDLAGAQDHRQWLCEQIDKRIEAGVDTDDLYVLVGALKVLGFQSELEKYSEKIRQMQTDS